MTGNHFGDIIVTSSNNDAFANTRKGDMVVYTETQQQQIHLGTQLGASPTMTITNSNVVIGGSLIPLSNIAFDLGSASNRFRDLYLSGNTIDLGGARLTNDGTNNVIIKDAQDNLKTLIVEQLIIGNSNTGEVVTLKQRTQGTLDIGSSTGAPTDVTTSNVYAQNIDFTGALTKNGQTFKSGADGLSNFSSNVFVVTGSNFGVGTSQPATLLDVAGTTTTIDLKAQNINFTGTLTQNGQAFKSGTTGLSNSSSNLFVVSGSNFGVGTSSPSTLFHVAGITTTSNVYAATGSVTTPAFTWSSDTDTGIYNAGANAIGFAANATNIATLSNTGLNLPGSLYTGGVQRIATDGGLSNVRINASTIVTGTVPTANLPTSSTTGSGIVQLADSTQSQSLSNAPTALALSNIANLASNALLRSSVVPNANLPSASTTVQGIVQLVDSTQSTSTTLAPTALALSNIANLASNALLRTGGTLTKSLNATSINTSIGIYGAADSSNLPSYSWSGDSNTGMYHVSTGLIGFSSKGSNIMQISSTGFNVSGQNVTGSNLYPPIALAGSTTTLSNQSYGNGTYVLNSSSNVETVTNAFDSNVSTAWSTPSNLYTLNAGYYRYIGSASTPYGSGLNYPAEWIEISLPNTILLNQVTIYAPATTSAPNHIAIFATTGATFSKIYENYSDSATAAPSDWSVPRVINSTSPATTTFIPSSANKVRLAFYSSLGATSVSINEIQLYDDTQVIQNIERLRLDDTGLLSVGGIVSASNAIYTAGTIRIGNDGGLSNVRINANNIVTGIVPNANLPAASTTGSGIVQLVDSTQSQSLSNAPTALALSNIANLASNALLRSGGTISALTSSNITASNFIAQGGSALWDRLVLQYDSGTAYIKAGGADYGLQLMVNTLSAGDAVTNVYSSALTCSTSNVKVASNLDVNGSITTEGTLRLDNTGFLRNVQFDASNLTVGTVPTARLPTASTTVAGILQLVDSTQSTSTTQAPTALALSNIANLASNALLRSGGTISALTSSNITASNFIAQGGSALWDRLILQHDGSTSYIKAGGADYGLSLMVNTTASGDALTNAYSTALTCSTSNVTVASNLAVNGTVYSTSSTAGGPATGTFGSTGDRVILWPGGASVYPYSLGIDSSTMWESVPSGAVIKTFIAGTNVTTTSSAGLTVNNSLTVSSNVQVSGSNIQLSGVPMVMSSNIGLLTIGASTSSRKIELRKNKLGTINLQSLNNKFKATSADAIKSVSTWTSRSSAIDNTWESICWSPELSIFVAVAYSGTGNRVMTSPDGITWTTRTSAADNSWLSVCWSPELSLFVVVGSSGTGNRVMTSPDGITWTTRSTPTDNGWNSVCWAPELSLFVAVALTGTNRLMTSPNGITWTEYTPTALAWSSVCWSPELALFVAVTQTNRCMTSSDGITWTTRALPADNYWNSVCWSPELSLFVAVASTGTGNRVTTSSDGITWTTRSPAVDNAWMSVCWSPELSIFVVVAQTGTGNRVMTSSDGITWTTRASAADNSWYSVCWSPELSIFTAVGVTGNSVMTTSPSILSSKTAVLTNSATGLAVNVNTNNVVSINVSNSNLLTVSPSNIAATCPMYLEPTILFTTTINDFTEPSSGNVKNHYSVANFTCPPSSQKKIAFTITYSYYKASGSTYGNYPWGFQLVSLDGTDLIFLKDPDTSGSNTQITGTVIGYLTPGVTYRFNNYAYSISDFRNQSFKLERLVGCDRVAWNTASNVFTGLMYNSNNGTVSLMCSNSNTLVASTSNVQVNGAILATGDVSAFSDISFKSDLQPIEAALLKVKQLTGYTFLRSDLNDGRRHVGLIAQELEQVLPEVVSHESSGKLSVAYGNIVALLIEAIKELTTRLEKVEQA